MFAIELFIVVWVICSIIGAVVFMTNFGSVRHLSTWKSFFMVIAFANLGIAIFIAEQFQALKRWFQKS